MRAATSHRGRGAGGRPGPARPRGARRRRGSADRRGARRGAGRSSRVITSALTSRTGVTARRAQAVNTGSPGLCPAACSAHTADHFMGLPSESCFGASASRTTSGPPIRSIAARRRAWARAGEVPPPAGCAPPSAAGASPSAAGASPSAAGASAGCGASSCWRSSESLAKKARRCFWAAFGRRRGRCWRPRRLSAGGPDGRACCPSAGAPAAAASAGGASVAGTSDGISEGASTAGSSAGGASGTAAAGAASRRRAAPPRRQEPAAGGASGVGGLGGRSLGAAARAAGLRSGGLGRRSLGGRRLRSGGLGGRSLGGRRLRSGGLGRRSLGGRRLRSGGLGGGRLRWRCLLSGGLGSGVRRRCLRRRGVLEWPPQGVPPERRPRPAARPARLPSATRRPGPHRSAFPPEGWPGDRPTGFQAPRCVRWEQACRTRLFTLVPERLGRSAGTGQSVIA